MKKTKSYHVFLGVKTADMEAAKQQCEALIGHPLQCSNGLFYGGDHCDADVGGGSFSLRLNHHDDGSGWSWCLDDSVYPLVFSCYFANIADAAPYMSRVKDFNLLVDSGTGVSR